MKKFVNTILFTAFFIGISIHCAAEDNVKLSLKQAENVVKLYFYALTQGNMGDLKRLSAGHHLMQGKSLFDKPSYSDYLRSTYANAKFQIIGAKWLNSNMVEVRTKITLNEEESKQLIYIIKKTEHHPTSFKRFVIYKEIEENLY